MTQQSKDVAAEPPEPSGALVGAAGADLPWLAVSALAAAAVAVGYAIHLRDGEFDRKALFWVAVGLTLCLAAVAKPATRLKWLSEGVALLTLCAGLLIEFRQYMISPPGGWNWWSNDLKNVGRPGFAVFGAALRVAGLCLALCLWKPKPLARYLVPLMLAAYLAMGAWMIRCSPEPHIDVFVFQQEGPAALFAGKNPYAIDFPDIYRADRTGDKPVYGQNLSQSGRLQFGFPYPPVSLLLAAAGYGATGDHRFAQLIAIVAAAALMASMRPGPPGRVAILAAGGFLFTPRSLFVLSRAWTEPFVVFLLALTVWCAIRRPRFLPLALGLFLASKQYLIFVPALAMLLCPRPWTARQIASLLGRAFVVAAAVTLPFALWGVRPFIFSLFTVQKIAPFREDALSFLVGWLYLTGHRPGVWPAFAGAFGGVALCLWRAPRAGRLRGRHRCDLPPVHRAKQAGVRELLLLCHWRPLVRGRGVKPRVAAEQPVPMGRASHGLTCNRRAPPGGRVSAARRGDRLVCYG